MTTDNGSSLSQAEVHLEVRQDILQDAASALQETINDSLIRWLVDWNFAPEQHQDLYPVFVIDSSPPEDVVSNQAVLSQALLDGVPLVADEYYEKVRLTKPEQYQDLEVIEPPAPASNDPFAFPAASLNAANGRRQAAAATGSRGRGRTRRNSEMATANHTVGSAVAPVPAQTATSAKVAAECGRTVRAIPPCSAAAQRQALSFAALHSGDPQLIQSAERELARLSAEAEDLLPADEIRELLREGVKSASASLDYLPGLVRDSFLEQATAALGSDALEREIDDEVLAALDGWQREWQADEDRTADFVDRLNDDVTIAGLLGWERVLLAADDEGLDTETQAALRSLPTLAAAADITNPLIESLFGSERIIPARVLSVLNRRVRQSVSYETFYQLDSLARSAAFTAHDLLIGDVRHIGAALQDATRWGYTVQQFSDYLYDRLEARYVVQGDALHAWHVETIFHQNLAHAWNTENMDAVYDLREDFPYLQFQNPSPQYPVCVEMAGRIWPTDSNVWREYMAPLHWGCGSSIVAITATRYEAEGLSVETSSPKEKPEVYQGPRDPQTGERVGKPAPFGAWAPLPERYAALEKQLKEARNG